MKKIKAVSAFQVAQASALTGLESTLSRIKCSLEVFATRHRQLLLLAVVVLFAALVAPVNAKAVDFSDITNQWSSIKTFLIFIGSAISAGCLIMSIVKFIGRDWGEALMWIAGAAGMGFVVAHAAGWVSSETGSAL